MRKHFHLPLLLLIILVGAQALAQTREALALALTGMMNDHEITRTQAVELAQMVLRGNAIKLYNLHNK